MSSMGIFISIVGVIFVALNIYRLYKESKNE